MGRLSGDTRSRQNLLVAALMLLSGGTVISGTAHAGDKFPNELNSPVDEPQVVIPEVPHRVPVRTASAAIQKHSDSLVKLVYETREAQRRRLLSTAEHTPWQMMHGLLGLRHDFLISHNGQTVSGLDWIKTGPMFKNEPWFQKTEHGGRAHPYVQPYWFEGHINQSLAILSMCKLPLDTQFGTPQGPITMRDMLRNAQMTANEKEEVTWTLWALATYLPSDAEWVNAKGERWSIERLVSLEVGKRVGGPTSPCGGTHGLFALAHARNGRLREGKALTGVWLEADQKVQKYITTAMQMQNTNGTLSSNFFRGKEYKQDFDKRMASCGHLLEFLMMALPQERLQERWVRRAIEATANDLMLNRKAYVSCSPLYHATNALSIYLDRMLPEEQPGLAMRPSVLSSSQKQIPQGLQIPPRTAMNPAGEKVTDSPTPLAGSLETKPGTEPTAALTPQPPSPDAGNNGKAAAEPKNDGAAKSSGVANEPASPTTPGPSGEPVPAKEPDAGEKPDVPKPASEPAAPVAPAAPGTPTDPAKPNEPSMPADPVTPTDPSKPAEPAAPSDPAEPVEVPGPLPVNTVSTMTPEIQVVSTSGADEGTQSVAAIRDMEEVEQGSESEVVTVRSFSSPTIVAFKSDHDAATEVPSPLPEYPGATIGPEAKMTVAGNPQEQSCSGLSAFDAFSGGPPAAAGAVMGRLTYLAATSRAAASSPGEISPTEKRSSGIRIYPAGRTRTLTESGDSNDLPPDDRPNQVPKSSSQWKSTPLERRRSLVIEERSRL